MAFVVTSGQIQSVERAPGFFGAPRPGYVQLSPTLQMTYEALWRAQPAVRTVVGFLARNVAQLPLDPYRRLSANDREKATDHPLARLLERPLGGTDWTKYRLINTLVHDLLIYDSAFWLKVRGPSGTTGLLPTPPTMITPDGGRWYAPERYLIAGNLGQFPVAPEAVVHFHGYNPTDPRIGVSPIETLRQTLAEEHAAGIYREQMWRNGARVAGVIKRPKDAPKWSDPARERFAGEWASLYTGDSAATGGTPVLEDGMEFAPSGVTPKDAQYVESRKLTREEVAVAYHVNPVMLGLMDASTMSSTKELHKMLYQDTLPPLLAQIAQDIECQLLEDIDPGAADGSVYVEFNISEKLRGSFEEQASAIQSSVGGPWLLRSEARSMFNLPHIADGDELIVPLNVTAGGLASPNDTAPNNPDNGPSNGQPPKGRTRRVKVRGRAKRPESTPIRDALRRHFERQRAAAMSALGDSKKAALDAPRWDVELAAELAPLAVTAAATAGRALLADVGLDPDSYDEPRTAGWLAAHTSGVAAGINATTAAAVAAIPAGTGAVAAVRALFDAYLSSRADQVAATEITALAGFGSVEAIAQAGGKAMKTWRAGANARPGHAAIDGETVAHDKVFSNGARWPGDSLLTDDQRCGCNCDLDIEMSDQ